MPTGALCETVVLRFASSRLLAVHSGSFGEHIPKGKQHLHFWQASQVLGLPVYALKIESCAKKSRRIVFASSFLNFLVTWGSSGQL